ncbi:MAG: hypothetical protein Q8S58_14650, partial [Bosea sp. (in: a-proteobacteria)]|nr:hypothetical protein [Bosea sp. (in: a-proteobacteria)]
MFEFEGFERRRLAIGLLAVALTLPFGAARAQAPATPAPLPIPAPAPTPTIGGTVDPMPVQPGPAPSARQAALRVAAQFAGDRKPIRSGLVWRVLSESADGSPPRIVARSSEPEPAFTLDPGTYLLHAAYGFASGTKRVTLGPLGLREQVA